MGGEIIETSGSGIFYRPLSFQDFDESKNPLEIPGVFDEADTV